jgi:DNA topoisomerase-1
MEQPGPFAEPAEAAKAAALRYVSDARPGFRRKRRGKGFCYTTPDGAPLRDPVALARIRRLAIPPAWREVWICLLAEGHLQATGRDARGRKQYRYHHRWRAVRDETKYERMLLFGATLPRIRSRVRKDLALAGLPRDKVLATIVRLLETSFIRVGNEEYARANKSFGLTTLRNRHVEIAGGMLRFRFQGKSGKTHTIDVNDRRLARLVDRCRDLPGQDLFQYLDESGEPQPIDSGAVNEYLRGVSGQDFTAKDFRTWAGTLLAAQLLSEHAKNPGSTEQPGPGLNETAAAVARRLGNTAAITRKCYIHPAVLAAHQNRALFELWTNLAGGQPTRRGLRKEESALLAFLRACSKRSLRSLLAESLVSRRRATERNSGDRGAAAQERSDGAARPRGRLSDRPARRARAAHPR